MQADLASGTADSFLQATHVARTRRATVVALYILKHCAYDHYHGGRAESSGIPTMV